MTVRGFFVDLLGALFVCAAGAVIFFDVRDSQVSALGAAVALAIGVTGGILINRTWTVALLTTLRELLASALRFLLTGSTEMPAMPTPAPTPAPAPAVPSAPPSPGDGHA